LLRDRVCVRNICINTLHKGDSGGGDDDDYDNNNNNSFFNNSMDPSVVTDTTGCRICPDTLHNIAI
jgi:hypothetical protein